MSRREKHVTDDPFQMAADRQVLDPFKTLINRPLSSGQTVGEGTAVAVARFHGFGPDERPLVADLPDLPGEIVAAQSVVPLRSEQIGSQLVLLFEGGDMRRPIVMGVLQGASRAPSPAKPADSVEVKADGDRYVFSAEREIVLRCGDASITLTRAGKVIIKGKYILSRSSGYNKIKGAAVDIN
jgi:hypothetical protein